jgi:hypothetical protein
MTDSHRIDDPQEHRDVSALLPWYVNDSIDEVQRRRVDAHLEQCAICREYLARELRVFQGMNIESPIQYMPTASLKRFQARLDGVSCAGEGVVVNDGEAVSNGEVVNRGRKWAGNPRRRRAAWVGLMAASVAVIAVAIGLLATDRLIQFRVRSSAPSYYTVTDSRPSAPEVVIRAVFAPTITLVELQALLDEAQLRIVSGPTEAGVYSLAANSRRPARSSLALLRTHPAVRFAESIQSSREAGRAAEGDTP